MQVSNKLLVYRWFEEVWNKKQESAIEEMLHSEAIVHGIGGTVMKGPAEFKKFHQAFVSAFPDMQVVVESILAEEEKVAARCSMRGTHTGRGLGISPTQKKVTMTGMTVVSVKDGKLFEGWNNWDFLGLYQQLGIVPAIEKF